MVSANGDRSRVEKVTFIRESDPPSDDLPKTVIDRYAEWASTATDAPEQYHRATGTVILSTILSPHISLDTSFGTIRPNIWAMILAGTTLTRKSTSMNMAKAMLSDILDDYLLATDGSPEGIFSELANRNNAISMFHRDEVTGFISAITGKDYLSGLLESFTQLYDGTEQKRVLRGQSIVVKNPHFIFFCGGIKTKMEELVGMEHIRSGFLPRFIFITGTTTSDQIRPIGPPAKEETKQDGTSPRDKVLTEFWEINKFFTSPLDDGPTPLTQKVGGLRATNPAPSPGSVVMDHKMEATPKAWKRIQDLQHDAMVLGERSAAPELYAPLFARLADSVIKVAILLAAADKRFSIDLVHVQNACRLAQEWLESLLDFAGAVEEAPEMDKWERKMDRIVQFVKTKHPAEVNRSEIMQKFRIRRKDMEDIQNTLRDRRLIEIVRERFSDGNKRNSSDGCRVYYKIPAGQMVLADGSAPNTSIEREDSYRAKGKGNSSSRTGRSGKRYRLSKFESAIEDTDEASEAN